MQRICLPPLRSSKHDVVLRAAIDAAIARKPEGHDFLIERRNQKPAVSRHMSLDRWLAEHDFFDNLELVSCKSTVIALSSS